MKRQTFLLLAMLALTASRALADEPVPAPSTGTLSLSLPQAINIAIQNNLTTQLAAAQSEEARGQALVAASALLPHILANVQQSRVFKQNLAAEGFSSLGSLSFNPLIGPYDVFDARLYLVQKIFDMSSIWLYKVGRVGIEIAHNEEDLAREQVASAAALAYLEALRSQESVASTQANLKLANDLANLARDEHRAGTSTGVDVARAETRAAEQNVLYIRAEVAAREAALRLKRVVGLPLEGDITLSDPFRSPTVSLPEKFQALTQAAQNRAELQIAEEELRADRWSLKAARTQEWPSLSGTADYGYSGNLPDTSAARTGTIGARFDLPIFYGGQQRGAIEEALGRERESEARYKDVRLQVEEDVRLALEDLSDEIEEVKTADEAERLAERELQMARDRYAAGAGDNIQVTSAQTALAQAREDQIEALARYNVARVNLAMSLGQPQTFKL